MSASAPHLGPSSFDPSSGGRTRSRRAIVELARIYVASSASASALEVLERLPPSRMDRESTLLRAEALIGLGRIPEAEMLLGPPTLPIPAPSAPSLPDAPRSPAARGPELDGALVPRPGRPARRRLPTRTERLDLWRFLLQLKVLHRSGRYREVLQFGRAYFDGRSIEPNVFVARIVVVMAQSTERLRRPAEARELYAEVLEVYRSLRCREGVADALLGLANTQLLDCQWDEADALYQESRFRYEEIGQSDKALSCLINLGVLRAKRGELDGGRSLLVQAMARASQMGETRRMGTIRLGLSLIDIREGRARDAMAHLLAVLRDARGRKAVRNRALALEFAGELYLAQGRSRRARACLAAGLRLARQMSPTGDLVFEIRRRQAECALSEGSLEEARVLALEASRMAREYGDVYESAVAERVLAHCDQQTGRPSEALGRVRSACDNLDRLGETYERARFELHKLQLELLVGQTTVERALRRANDVERPYETCPRATVRRDVSRFLGFVEGLSADRRRSLIEVSHPAATASGQGDAPLLPSDPPLTGVDLELARSLGLVGDTRCFNELLRTAIECAECDVPVVILGEPGVGKSLLARFLHLRSRRVGSFLSLRVAGLDEHVARAELFGGTLGSPFEVPALAGPTVQGAVASVLEEAARAQGLGASAVPATGSSTGTSGRPGGLFAAAARGTLAFEAMGEVAVTLQARLGEWLERATASADPERRPRYVFIARQPLRGELVQRLGARVLRVPSLRLRTADIPSLCASFANELCDRYGIDRIVLPADMVRDWAAREWPGNLRALRTAVESYVLKRGDL